MKQSSLNFVFINGRGSSGKDTQANFLAAENPNAIRISTGDIVRGAKTPDGSYGKYHEQLKPYFELTDKGGLIPDNVIVDVVGQEVRSQTENGKNMFIFTGFPRTIKQLCAVDDYIESLREQYGDIDVDHICYAVLELHSKQRAEYRRIKALKTGAEIRKDDEPDTVAQRLKTYKENTDPMLHLLVDQQRLIIIKSSGTIEEVRERTKRALGILKPITEGQRNPHKER